MGTMLVTTSCSDNELEKGNDGPGTVDPVNASPLVKVYADEKGENYETDHSDGRPPDGPAPCRPLCRLSEGACPAAELGQVRRDLYHDR